VIAARMAIENPARYAGVILEALHLEREKPRSRAFFTMMAEDPDGFGERVTSKLAADHGESWRDVLRAGGRAWLDIAATPDEDFFDHRLGELSTPVMVIHGSEDPRTEPGELDRVIREVPSYEWQLIAKAAHCPHSEKASWETCRDLAGAFTRRVMGAPPPPRNHVMIDVPAGRVNDVRIGLRGEQLGTRVGDGFTTSMTMRMVGEPPAMETVGFTRVVPDEYEVRLLGSTRSLTFAVDSSHGEHRFKLTEEGYTPAT
jgi:hypothetical protein